MTKLTEIVIRVVGSWNTKIFTPIWISETLLNFNIKDSLEIVFNKELQPAFIFKGIRIIPNENYVDVLIFKAGQELTTETKEIAAKVVLNLMTTLPFTPKLGVGFNYKVEIDEEVEKKPDPLFPGFELTSFNLRKDEDDFQLNLIISFENNSNVLFNFHVLNLESINSKTVDNHLEYINNLWKTRN
ncbi:hypothetical protein [Runella sp.]|jgi:hypothetical protein|uniref:hypothetical protein n=1 Tax=Runella sp. TaxID=1960881 RepID=UPI002639FF9D|nr:hypothetical protein [Runella sp.]